MTPDLHATVAERLRLVGQRYTHNRRELVRALDESDRPLTITDLLDATSDVPQSSAYRNLSVLEEAGVVVRVAAADDFARFELSEDLTGHHHHLICTGCGTVEDFTLPAPVERRLETALTRATSDTGFDGQHHRLDVMGRCRTCAWARPPIDRGPPAHLQCTRPQETREEESTMTRDEPPSPSPSPIPCPLAALGVVHRSDR